MPKNSKQKNDLRGMMQGIRRETALIFVLSAIVCLVLYIAISLTTEADKLYSGVLVGVLLCRNMCACVSPSRKAEED